MNERPNIVLITCHDLGQHLCCYGIPSVRTETIDSLAQTGVRFENSFCTSPGCSPSRAAIATGRYPHNNGVMGLAHADFGWDLRPDEWHLATLLAEGGYRTALFGLQHVTYNAGRLGFKEILPERPADAVAQNLEDFLQSGRADSPFYFEINFFEPHRPFDFGGVSPDYTNGVYIPGFLPENQECREEIGAMQGAIHKVDESIERFVSALKTSGQYENTLILFTADHGIAFPRAKCTLYDPGIETALIMNWPAANFGGQTRNELISNIDIAPTLLEAAQLDIPERIMGRSFWPLLTDGEYEENDEIFAEKTFHGVYDPIRCIRTHSHKLIVNFDGSHTPDVPADIIVGGTYQTMVKEIARTRKRFELYDLGADLWEKNNVAGSEQLFETETDLKQRLFAWMQDTEDPLLEGPVPSPHYEMTMSLLADT